MAELLKIRLRCQVYLDTWVLGVFFLLCVCYQTTPPWWREKVMVYYFILSLRTGIFPDCLKLARVTPIPKGGDSTPAGIYRPISVLPIVSKIFEKVVYSCDPYVMSSTMSIIG